MDKLISINPDGIEFPIPKESDYDTEFTRIEKLVSGAQKSGQEIVVVMGIGFVGSVMAAIVADTVDKNSNPSKFVIGLDLPTKESYWKISMINNADVSLSTPPIGGRRELQRSFTERTIMI